MEASRVDESSSLSDDVSGIIGEYSIPHMPLMSSESLLSQSQYAKVIFHDIADTYSTDADVCCRYTLTAGVTPAHGDRISLFRVGWSSVNEYEVFEFTPEPDPQNKEQKEFQVLFKAGNLPKDVREFYQLCYVTASGTVCGASVPFQFRHLQDEDLCVVEGPEGMAVVRTRTALAEERLRQESEARGREKFEAKKKLKEMEEGYSTVTRELQATLQQVSSLETENKVMEAKLKDLDHMDRLLTSLKKDYEVLDVEKNDACTKQKNAELRVEVLNETIKALTLDKEHLTTLLRAEACQTVDVAQYRSQADGLQAMLEALSQSKEMVAQELRAEQESGKQLREALEYSKADITRMEKRIQALSIEKQSLQSVLNDTLKGKTSSAFSGGKVEQVVMLEELRQENEHLLAQLTLKAGDKEELCRLREVLKERNRELVSVQESLDIKQGCTDMIITKLRTKIKEQEQELLDSRRLLQEEKLKQEDMITASVNEQQIISAKKIEELQRELVEVKKTLEDEKSKQAGIESTALNEQRKIFAKRINQLERELVEVKNSQDQKRIKENVKDKLKEELASMQANKVVLEGELRDVTRSITEWTERVNVVEFRLEEVTATYSEIQTELQQVLIMLDMHRDEYLSLQKVIETKERDLQDELGQSAAMGIGYAGSELSRAKEEITHKEAFVESSFMRAEELKVKKEELEQEKTVLEQQLKYAKEGKVEREVVRCELVDRLAQKKCEILRLLGTGHQQDQPPTSMLDDLKRRLQQAAVEYQKLYEEKQKVERRLNKLLHRKVPGSLSPLATPPAEPVTEPASVQDLLPESGTCRDVPTAPPPLPETTTTGGPDFSFVCPFCKVTFPPGAYDLFTEHFDNHLS